MQHETEVTEREAAPPVKPVAPPPRAVQARPMARPGAAVRRPAPALPASERTVRMPRATVLSAIPAQLAESMRRGELPEPATPSAVDDDYVVEVVAPRKG